MAAQLTPRSLGFRMPAEWEPHEATWLAWPHEKSDWPGKFAPVPWLYGEIVRLLARADVKAKFLATGAEATGSTPQQLANLVKADSAKWSKVIRDAGIKLE